MPGYTKLFSSIVHSTVWREEMHVKVVWVTMLALANRRGEVEASLPGLADASRVTLDLCHDALKRLSSPDTYSRTKDFEGRRIEECDGGWRILNHPKYRDLLNSEERKEQVREAVQRHRDRRKTGNQDVIGNQDVSIGKPPSAQATPTPTPEADAKGKEETTLVGLAPDGGTSLEMTVQTNGNGKKPKGTAVQRQSKSYQQAIEAIGAVMADVAAKGAESIDRERRAEFQCDVVFSYWAAKMHHQGTYIDSKRRRFLMARLQENHGDVHELLFVVDGVKRDKHLMGQNDRDRKYDGISTIFRDREQVERLAVLGGYKPGTVHPRLEEVSARLTAAMP